MDFSNMMGGGGMKGQPSMQDLLVQMQKLQQSMQGGNNMNPQMQQMMAGMPGFGIPGMGGGFNMMGQNPMNQMQPNQNQNSNMPKTEGSQNSQPQQAKGKKTNQTKSARK